MSDCKPTSTPGYGPECSNKQPEDTLLDEEETRRYQGIVGCLMYIAQGLRYDLIYATGQLAHPMSKPSKVHLVARLPLPSTDDRLSYHLQEKKVSSSLPSPTRTGPTTPTTGSRPRAI